MTTTATTAPDATTSTTVDLLVDFARTTVTVSGEAWTVAVADTPELRAQGLMGVTDLGELDGMLFVFQEDAASGFWMKNTLIPLDMIWVDTRFKVVAILEAVPCKADPCPNYDPEAEAAYVVELNRGMAKRHGLKVGATLAFRDVPEPARVR